MHHLKTDLGHYEGGGVELSKVGTQHLVVRAEETVKKERPTTLATTGETVAGQPTHSQSGLK